MSGTIVYESQRLIVKYVHTSDKSQTKMTSYLEYENDTRLVHSNNLNAYIINNISKNIFPVVNYLLDF